MEKRSRRATTSKKILNNAMVALLISNFKKLSVEKKTLIISHFFVFLFCFFPWLRITPYEARTFEITVALFSRENVSLFLMLTIIFIAILVLLLFVDTLLNLKKVKIPFSRDYIYLFAGTQQFILCFLAISALYLCGKLYGDSSILFGFFACLVSIIAGMVATFLEIRNEKKREAHEFFQTPGETQEAQTKTTTQPNLEKSSPINHIDKD